MQLHAIRDAGFWSELVSLLCRSEAAVSMVSKKEFQDIFFPFYLSQFKTSLSLELFTCFLFLHERASACRRWFPETFPFQNCAVLPESLRFQYLSIIFFFCFVPCIQRFLQIFCTVNYEIIQIVLKDWETFSLFYNEWSMGWWNLKIINFCFYSI